MTPLKLEDFAYRLPPELIAQTPASRRDQSRLLVVHRATGALDHRRFAELPACLRAGDLLVVNNTRVIPARLFGHKPTGGRVELLLLEELTPAVWEALLQAGSRRPRSGAVLTLADGQATATLLAAGENGRVTVRLASALPITDLLDRFGQPPLPPYIRRAEGRGPKAAGASPQPSSPITHQSSLHAASPNTADSDRERYQTVYACHPGAVAAPTAGLHFTPELLATLAARGVRRAAVTLHVGLGTFRPIVAALIAEHRMEAERYVLPPETAALLAQTQSAGGRIVAVGSTSVRALETVAAEHAGRVVPAAGRSRLFIYPPYAFRVVDALLTNFHLPKSTLLLMVCAFAGRDLIWRAYAEAIRERYRFYSYGDAMLIL